LLKLARHAIIGNMTQPLLPPKVTKPQSDDLADMKRFRVLVWTKADPFQLVDSKSLQCSALVLKTSCGKFHFQLQPKDVANQLSRICQ
jgi:hypothetical protein